MTPYIAAGLNKKIKNGNRERVSKAPKDTWKETYVVQHAVLKYLGLTYFDIMKTSKKEKLVDSRNLLIWFLWKRTRMTNSDLVGYFGRHHTTILYSIRAVENLLATTDEWTQKINKINSMIN